METYYSQHGEDFLLNKIFDGKTSGYYVEIGCLDGIEFSNTYFFEKKGWKGLCIEAHRDFIGALKRNRPAAEVVHCAVGEADKESVTFYANKLGSLSTLDKNEEERWNKNYKPYFHGFDEQQVRMRTLTSIFNEKKVTNIDFVSLDIEGYEVQALSGLDFTKYKPTVFIIEYKDDEHKRQLEEILINHGYHYLSKLGCNLFYSQVAAHKEIVTAAYGRIPLVQIDMEGVVHHHTADHLTPTLSRKISSFLKRSLAGKAWQHAVGLKNQFLDRLRIPSYHTKRNILDGYRKKYQLTTLVETGTFLGDTVDFFKNKFERVYSIELSPDLFRDAEKRFENVSNVKIIQGDSGELLGELTKQIDAPALYWLDGHYSSEFYVGDKFVKTAKGERVTPIIKELDALLNDKHRHVILIDDARLFNGTFDYPKISTVTNMISQHQARYRAFVRKDIIHVVPND